MKAKTHTTAQRIAAALMDDGIRWETDDGVTLDQLAAEHGGRLLRDPGRGLVTYRFGDGSSIVCSAAGWDLGYVGNDCTCWAEVGHRADCEAGL